ncbi:ferric reductase-like transmembrane domain-containing protein [Anabaena sp. CCY 0017]|uniref:ferric reductase-like transmembrane domain-containing protein n=1 Tax=Anabaena sp. CCY 0017 TaxID=3103866 RepID=UPI0039C5D1B2
MRLNFSISKQSLIFLILYLSSYIAFVLLGLYFRPVPLANFLGCLALLFYTATLVPSILRVVFPNTRGNKILIWLLKKRRHIGIISYILASNHGLLLMLQRNINFLHLETYIHYFQGIFMFFIMTLLAITSNDWSMKALKKNWVRLHQLTYLIIFVLPWHILDKMSWHWSYLTPLVLLVNFICIYFFMKRKILEHQI